MGTNANLTEMLKKHSVNIRGHNTSFSLEDSFWIEFRKIADAKNQPLARLITRIDEDRDPDTNLSSAIRLYVLEHLLKD